MAALRRTVRPFQASGTALITGASAGLGAAYARAFAARGMDLILAARSAEPMAALAAEVRSADGREVTVCPVDLTDRHARADLIADLADRGQTVDVLVNNAGFGTKGDFIGIDAGRLANEIELNVAALTALTRAYLPGMVQRRHGAVLNIASLAGFQPLPTMSVYAATKAYVRSLSLALWEETRGTGVRVLSVCPGPVETEFWENAQAPDIMTRRRSMDQVLESTFRALDQDQPEVVDGLANRVLSISSSLAPKRLALTMAKRFAE